MKTSIHTDSGAGAGGYGNADDGNDCGGGRNVGGAYCASAMMAKQAIMSLFSSSACALMSLMSFPG